MKYYAKIYKDEYGDFMVEFPELEGCITSGETLEEAKHNAWEALNGWLAASCDLVHNIPEPKTKKGTNYYPIDVEPSVALSLSLRFYRFKKGISQKKAAEMIGISQQVYSTLEIPGKSNPTLKTLQKIKNCLMVEFNFNIAA